MSEEADESEKTEDPSQRKLEEAHKRGDVAKSQELSSFFVMAGAALSLLVFAGPAAHNLSGVLGGVLQHAGTLAVDPHALVQLTYRLGGEVALAVIVPFLLLIGFAVAGNLAQHMPVWSLDPITPKFSKVSPLAGFKRLFSKESLVNFAKGIAKIGLVSTAIWVAVWPERDRLDAIVFTDVSQILPATIAVAVRVFIAVLALMFLFGAADFAYQKWRWFQKQKMTVREVKDEYKQQEGDPTIKAKLRQIRLQRSRRRMMAQVPDATVVITNPTHYAVALKYEAGMPAPLCLAKGVDALALRIRETARGADVPIVENRPLARALYASVEIDQEIPAEHYKAVAEVIGFVMRLRDRRRRRAR